MSRQAKALDVLLAEVNKAAPKRSKASDGGLGDEAHSSRESDHNPNSAGVWRARDFTHDPRGGLDAGKLAQAIRDLGRQGHPALGPGSYVIYDRRIASATQDGAPWDWEPYSGSNPHTKHVHVSVSTAARGYDSTKKWGVMTPKKKAAPKPNHVEKARKLIEQAIDELEQTPLSRTVAHTTGPDRLRAVLAFLPED